MKAAGLPQIMEHEEVRILMPAIAHIEVTGLIPVFVCIDGERLQERGIVSFAVTLCVVFGYDVRHN